MTQARLFTWQSEALKDYGLGYIIVVATNIEEARRFAKLEMDEYARKQQEGYYGLDEYEMLELREMIYRDLSAEPKASLSLLIRGSE